MYKSPSNLPEQARNKICESLNQRLVDGLDLHSQIKVAHWNIKGPQFAALHPLFETFAIDLAEYNDQIAERAVTLGAKVYGTVRHVSKTSKIPEYPQDTTRDLEHARNLVERFDSYLKGLRETRAVLDQNQDVDSVDLVTTAIEAFEKHSWFLRATLET